MSKRKDYECPYTGCTEEFKDGMNQENFNRHVNSCKFKTTKKKEGGIVSYFTAQPPLPTLSEGNNTPSTSYDCTNIADEIEITSNVNTEVETIQVGQIREDAGTARKECKGFLVDMEKGSTKSGPCSNRPITCIHCKTIQWSYNLPRHCQDKHSNHPIPTAVTDDEKRLMGV